MTLHFSRIHLACWFWIYVIWFCSIPWNNIVLYFIVMDAGVCLLASKIFAKGNFCQNSQSIAIKMSARSKYKIILEWYQQLPRMVAINRIYYIHLSLFFWKEKQNRTKQNIQKCKCVINSVFLLWANSLESLVTWLSFNIPFDETVPKACNTKAHLTIVLQYLV